MRCCHFGVPSQTTAILTLLLCLGCQPGASFREAMRFVSAKDSLFDYEIQVTRASNTPRQAVLGGVRVFSQEGVLLGTTSLEDGRLRFKLKNEDEAIFLSPDPEQGEQLLLAGGWFKLSEIADPLTGGGAGQLRVALSPMNEASLFPGGETLTLSRAPLAESLAVRNSSAESLVSQAGWSEENLSAEGSPLAVTLQQQPLNALPAQQQARGQGLQETQRQAEQLPQNEQSAKMNQNLAQEVLGLGALRYSDEQSLKSVSAWAPAFGQQAERLAASEWQDENFQSLGAARAAQPPRDQNLARESLEKQKDLADLSERQQPRNTKQVALEREAESRTESTASLGKARFDDRAESTKEDSDQEAELPRSLARLGEDVSFRSGNLRFRSYFFHAIDRAKAEPLSGVRLFGVSTAKFFELELGLSDENGKLSVKVPSAMKFELLRADSAAYGARIVPLMASSADKPQEISFGNILKDTQESEKTISLSAMYPSFGLWRFFSGGQLKQPVKGKKMNGGLEQETQNDLAGSLALFSLKQPQNTKNLSENPLNRGRADRRVHEKGTQGKPADEELEGFRIGPKGAEQHLQTDAVPLFEHPQLLDEGVFKKVDLNSSSHIYLRFFSRQPLKPRVAIHYETDHVFPLLDASLVQRFKRSVQAYFVTEKKFIPVLEQSLKELSGASAEALLAGWEGTHLDALLDLICVIKASQQGLILSWKNRKGTELSRVSVSYSTDMPPELFARRVYGLALDHFPDELIASAQWNSEIKNFESVNIETDQESMISKLSSGDIVEVKTFVQGTLLNIGSVAIERKAEKQQRAIAFVNVSPAFRNAADSAMLNLRSEADQNAAQDSGAMRTSTRASTAASKNLTVQLLLTRVKPARSQLGLALGNQNRE